MKQIVFEVKRQAREMLETSDLPQITKLQAGFLAQEGNQVTQL
jgi:hypothetical protein